MPERPVTGVKPSDQKLTQRRSGFPRMRQDAAISFRKNLELQCLQLRAKFSHQGAKGREVDLFEFRTRCAELLKQPEEMFRSATDRNSRETLSVRKFSLGQQLFRREGKEETQVFARRREASALDSQKGTK